MADCVPKQHKPHLGGWGSISGVRYQDSPCVICGEQNDDETGSSPSILVRVIPPLPHAPSVHPFFHEFVTGTE
jgi:hypothetical protein